MNIMPTVPKRNILNENILISNITINGGTLLVGNDLEGYCLHIDYSKNGKVINDNINTI